MRFHTGLSYDEITKALVFCRKIGRIPEHVFFFKANEHGSRTHLGAWEIRLATYDKTKGDKRTFLNSGNHGAQSERNGYEGLYSATYDEWGWFIAALYILDGGMKCAGMYDNADDFKRKTHGNYALSSLPSQMSDA